MNNIVVFLQRKRENSTKYWYQRARCLYRGFRDFSDFAYVLGGYGAPLHPKILKEQFSLLLCFDRSRPGVFYRCAVKFYRCEILAAKILPQIFHSGKNFTGFRQKSVLFLGSPLFFTSGAAGEKFEDISLIFGDFWFPLVLLHFKTRGGDQGIVLI